MGCTPELHAVFRVFLIGYLRWFWELFLGLNLGVQLGGARSLHDGSNQVLSLLQESVPSRL